MDRMRYLIGFATLLITVALGFYLLSMLSGDGSEQLFDLYNDPHELEDLSGNPGYSAQLRDWRAELADHFTERGEPYLVEGKLAPRAGKSMLYSPNYPGAAEIQQEKPNVQ